MTGLPPGIAVSVEFDPINHPNVWTDVTADVDAVVGISIKYGRTSEFSAPSPATMNLTLDDTAGKYTVHNAASPYWPNIRPRRRIQVQNSYGNRYTGYILGWPPGFDGTRRIVNITATDRLTLLGRRILADAITEELLLFPPSFYFPMNDTGSDAAGVGLHLAEWRQACSPLPFSVNGATTPIGFHVVGGIAPQTGPWDTNWVRFTPQGAPGLGSGTSWQANLATNASPTNPVVTGNTWMFSVAFRNIDLTYAGSQNLWFQPDVYGGGTALSYQYTGGATASMNLAVNDNTTTGQFLSWTIPADTLPHVVRVAAGDAIAGSGVNVYIDGVVVATGAFIAGPIPGSFGVYGPASVGAGCYMDIAHLAIWQGAAAISTGLTRSILTGFVGQLTGTAVSRICTYAGVPGALINPMAGTVTMGYYQQAGKNAQAALQDIATTEGGGAVVWVNTNGQVEFDDSTFRKPGAPALTVDALKDIDGGSFEPQYDELTLINQSAVTANTSGVVFTYTDAASLAEFLLTTDSATSYASTDQAAQNLAQDRVSRQSQPALRVTPLTLDMLTATGTATYPSLQSVTMGSRVRVANIPTTVTGASGTVVYFPYSQVDVVVEGWSETIAIDTYAVVFDTSPADAPARFVWDDVLYGRWQADPGSMTVQTTITAGATSVAVVTAGSSPRITTAGGDLPFYLIIGEEVVQVTAVGGGTSPQTLTIVRAQLGTIASAHASGAVVSVYPTATWTM